MIPFKVSLSCSPRRAKIMTHLLSMMLELSMIFLLPYFTLLLLLWIAKTRTRPSRISDFIKKHILILIAHPDDEACFFGPTILTLIKENLENDVVLIFISTGDIDGEGEIREKELQQSAQLLGLPSTAINVVNDAKLEDGGDWNKHDISNGLTDVIKQIPWPHPDIIITFDERGVTNHPNHNSLLPAAILFSSAKTYALRTVSLLTAVKAIAKAVIVRGKQDVKDIEEVIFMSRLSQWRRTVRAANKHKSQKKGWFSHRWLLMNLSVYQVANILKLCQA
jgi:N-acetylglucosaminylphosphatidylinositol deacetylase